MADEILLLGGENIILLKKAIAKLLYSRKYGQSSISRMLSITQPMVSNYISSKTDIPRKIYDYAKDVISMNKPLSFQNCVSFSDKQPEGQYLLAKNKEILTDEKKQLISSLTDAFLILKGLDITKIMPEVKMNLAMAIANPKTKDDIASFSNGLIIIDNKVSSISSIQFGRSRHLSSLLLHLNSFGLGAKAVMNIKFNDKIKKDYKYAYLTKDFKLKEKKKADILLHKGDFGIEPCSYVLGKDALDVAKKVEAIVNG
jgi:predicted fused transcriptional regulator/phosphomethylpyrimidine kinase